MQTAESSKYSPKTRPGAVIGELSFPAWHIRPHEIITKYEKTPISLPHGYRFSAFARPIVRFRRASSAAQDASGYFTVSQVNGVWWLIDPNGKQVVSRGLDVLQFDDTYVDASGVSALQQSNLKLYGSVEKWRTAIMQRMSDLGFNTAGAWSDPEFLGAHIDATLPLAETRVVYLGQPFVAEKFGNDA